jgi:hypothetical protein
MATMTTYAIPQCNVLGLKAGKPYLAFTETENVVTVRGDDYLLYQIDRIHDESFTVVNVEGGVVGGIYAEERPTDRDMCNKYERDVAVRNEQIDAMREYIDGLEQAVLMLTLEKYNDEA